MEKVVEYFQRDNSSNEQSEKVTKAYELYQSALANFSSIDNNNKTRKEFMNLIYEDNFESLIPNLTIMQLYEMSIAPYRSSYSVYTRHSSEEEFVGHFIYRVKPPIESLMFGPNGKGYLGVFYILKSS